MPNTAADLQVPVAAATSRQICWLALTLTPGLGPTRAKRLVEFFGGVEAVFNASLTELEAAGLSAAAAQSLGTGKSVELAHDEITKALARALDVLPSTTQPTQPVSAKSTILHLSSTCAATSQHSRNPALP